MNEVMIAILNFALAFGAIFLVQPSVAQVALAKNLMAPEGSHAPGIPLLSMGGVSMFIGINLSLAIFSTNEGFAGLHPLIAALIILLFSGLLLDTNMAFRYVRQLARLLAAAVLVLHSHGTPNTFFPGLPPWLNAVLQMAFVIGFMYGYHELVLHRKMTFLYLALLNALVFFLFMWQWQAPFNDILLALSLSGSLSGILVYSRYARIKNKPLPLIGHTGTFLIAIILAALWLEILVFWAN
ncbi:hypothetical protein [Sunxiuqinia dokdonensis]|nr:hypothetical protein [Sunxiuqinia dokdonensis]